MRRISERSRRQAALWLGGVSVLAVMTGSAAFAQDQETPMETVIVTGVRASLQSAQAIKENADTIVDSITATDIGMLPDKSVAEALKRVPGVTVSQYASPSDSAHFSAEPSTVLIRGLTQVRSEFNGRDVFQADSSRGLSFADVSPELMAGVDTYKNQTADMIEGGLAGTVNLRTRVPFDSDGRVIAAGAKLNWGTLAHRATPDFSAIYSDRFDTKYGEFGVMLDSAYSMVKTASDGTIVGRFFQLTNPAFVTTNTPDGTAWIPAGSSAILTDVYTRERIGGASAVQWQNPSRTMLATVQYNVSHYRQAFTEHRTNIAATGTTNTDGQMQPVPSTGPQLPLGAENDWVVPAPGTSFTFDDNGMFTSGIMLGKSGWANQQAFLGTPATWTDAGGNPHWYFNTCVNWMAGWTGCTDPDPRMRAQPWISNESRYNNNIADIGDLSANFKYDVTDNLHLNFDAQWVHSTVTGFDMTANIKSAELLNMKLSQYGVSWEDVGPGGPSTNTWMASTPTSLGIDTQAGGWTNLANYFPEFAMDHYERDKGNEFAWRGDAEYDFHTKWLDSLKVGVRGADRNQQVGWYYNWKATCASWANCPASHQFANQFDSQYFDTYTFPSSLLGGGVFPGVALPYITINTMVNVSAAKAMLAQDGGLPSSQWVPMCDRPTDVAGTCFQPAELMKVDERTWAGYAMLKFGGSDVTFFNGQVTMAGNIGVRVVNTTITSSGGVYYPTAFLPRTVDPPPINGVVPPDPFTLIDPNDKLFSDGAQTFETVRHNYMHVLPSLNIKFTLPSDWVARLAVSRAMSRPDLGLLRSYAQLSHDTPSIDPNNMTATLHPTYTASAGNPGLKPMYADMIDVSFERYFSAVGNFALDFFYKKFHDYFQYAHYYRDFTHNGVTRTALVYGPVNGTGGDLKGLEASYTRYFDFLPSPFDGMGIQANIVALQNSGIASTGLSDTLPGTQATGFQNLPLEGLSDLSWNLIAMYEKGPVAVRLAYDWRSKYMVTAADCCAITDVWQRPYGQLDGSIHYRFGEHWEVALQGTNVLGARSVLQQQVADPRLLLPRSWFETDRRVEFAVRMKY